MRVRKKCPEEEADFLKHFSLGIQNFMKRTGLSIQDIADKLGTTHSAVSAWKRGKGFPDYHNFINLIVLGMSPLEVMNIELENQARINDCEAQIQENNNVAKAIMKATLSFDKIQESLTNIRDKNLHLQEEITKLNMKKPNNAQTT